MSGLTLHNREVKKLIRKSNLPETYFVARYGLAPYMACSHGCVYCDGRCEKYYVEGDFARDIVVRTNCVSLLERELAKLREPGIITIGSGVTDGYQHIEKKLNLTGQCAALIEKAGTGAGVLTKSSLIERDIDTWHRVHENAGFTLYISLTFTDDAKRAIFEPGASPVEKRLETIRKFKERGIPVGVLAMPIIPFVSDSESELDKLFSTLKELDVDFIMPGSTTLRPGRQKELFFSVIGREFPHLLPEFETLYRENRQSGSPLKSYCEDLYSRVYKLLDRYGFQDMPPYYAYRRGLTSYDRIYVLLHHMKGLYKRKGIDIKRLEMAAGNYSSWLLGEKKAFNRKRSRSYRDLEALFKEKLRDGTMAGLLGNEKIARFMKEIILEHKLFDYKTLTLQEGEP